MFGEKFIAATWRPTRGISRKQKRVAFSRFYFFIFIFFFPHTVKKLSDGRWWMNFKNTPKTNLIYMVIIMGVHVVLLLWRTTRSTYARFVYIELPRCKTKPLEFVWNSTRTKVFPRLLLKRKWKNNRIFVQPT